jgi:NAD-dependent oxidoreductase involved in siderophore biosynthesis
MTTWALANAAEVAMRQSHWGDAARHQRACLRLATALGQPVYVAYSAIVAARLVGGSDPAMATRLLVRALDALTESSHELYPDDAEAVEQLLARSADALGDEDYHREEAAGHSMGLDDLADAADGVLERRTGS